METMLVDEYLDELQNKCREVLSKDFKGKSIVILSREDVEKAIKILKYLSNPIKLTIVWILLQTSMPVCLLTTILKVERTLVSHYLRELKEADIVYDRVKGKFKYYPVNPKLKPILKKTLLTLFER